MGTFLVGISMETIIVNRWCEINHKPIRNGPWKFHSYLILSYLINLIVIANCGKPRILGSWVLRTTERRKFRKIQNPHQDVQRLKKEKIVENPEN